MNIKEVTKVGLLTALAVIVGVLASHALVGADNTEIKPGFNKYQSVKLHYGVGPESDFLRFGTKGELGNTLEVCQDGQVVDMWLYVHNSSAAVNNGANFDGPGVATGTTVSLNFDKNQVANSHSLRASIDSDQTAAITDSATIQCADKKIKLTYKGISDWGTSASPYKGFGNFEIVGNPAENGLVVGYNTADRSGIVPGCWEFRARVNLQVIVNVIEDEQPEEPVDKPEEKLTDTSGGSELNSQALSLGLAIGLASVAALSYRLVKVRNIH